MAELLRRYRFLGTGIIWDAEKGEPLCHFDRSGIFETSDPYKIRKLIKLRTPYEDGKADELSNAEYAIGILEDKIKVLEQINEDLSTRLERFESQKEIDKKPTREAIIAELELLGIPYLMNSNDTTLLAMLEEYKELKKNQNIGIYSEES